jgi:hypothetical protein
VKPAVAEFEPRIVPFGPLGLWPQGIRHIYGFDQIQLSGAVSADGSGQTIAIIDFLDDPTIVADLQTFDAQFQLPDPPNLIKLNQTGGTDLPPAAPPGAIIGETSLDVEWAHALTPGANIILYEASPAADVPTYLANAMAAVQSATQYAGPLPPATVVSMSFGIPETQLTPQLLQQYDGIFTTPPGHPGITFLASTGDAGAGPQFLAPNGFEPPEYPAISPNVVAVGGTTLNLFNLDRAGNYPGEWGWGFGSSSYPKSLLGGGGGGVSQYEPMPAYQHEYGVRNDNGGLDGRSAPDVAFDADPLSGVAVYDSSAGWNVTGGTSFSAPAWAALIALADQARALAGEGSLDGPTQTLPLLYQLPDSDYHDITTGDNGYPAGPGYDLVTGLGTPIASRVVGDLWGQPAPVANDDSYSISPNTTLIVNATQGVLANDTDRLGEPLTATWYTNPAHGTLTVHRDGSFTYQPSNNFIGTDSFTYTIQDTGTGVSSTATVRISVQPPLPDLAPYQPSDWDGPIVVATQAGGTTDASTIITTDTVYVDWAAINQGNAAVTDTFHSELLLDGNPVTTWYTDPPVDPTGYVYVRDFSLGQLTAGSHTLTLVIDYRGEVTENNEDNNTVTITFLVNQAPAITSAASTTFAVGTPGSFTFTTTGWPIVTISEIGTLPPGLHFQDNGDGTTTLTGTPAAGSSGTYSLHLTGSNGAGADASQTFTLTVGQSPAFTSAASITFMAGTPGSFTATASGFPAPSLSESGRDLLPSGITFDASTGMLSGTPASGSGGIYTLHFAADNGIGRDATQTFILTIDQAPAITSLDSTSFAVGVLDTFRLAASGFPAPTLQESGSDALPAGVTFNPATGVLSGTPAAGSGGTYTLHFTARNGVADDARQTVLLTVNEAPAFPSADRTTFTVGTPGTFTVTRSGFPVPTLSVVGALPNGVILNPATGVLSGTPAGGSGGTYTLQFTARNSSGADANQIFHLTVNQAAALLGGGSTTFTAGTPLRFALASTGFPAPIYKLSGALPSGVTFDPTTGIVSGTSAPTSAGTYPIVITASNGVGLPASQTVVLTINPPVLPGPVNITPLVSIYLGPLTPIGSRRRKAGGRFQQTVIIRNNTPDVIAGPLVLVLDGLAPRRDVRKRLVPPVTLINAVGTTQDVSPGSPFLSDSAGLAQLAPSGHASFVLTFLCRGPGPINFNPIVLAGFAQP